MPLPLAPAAVIALRCSALALTAWAARRALARRAMPGRRDQRVEDAFDELPGGITRQSDPTATRASLRLSRRYRIGATEWHLDAAMIARLRLKRVKH